MESQQSIESLIQGESSEDKLKNALVIIETLEKENFKLRIELKKSEALILKLQESSIQFSQNQNNTSSAFTLPSEFKALWEKLVQENILDLFSPFMTSYQTMVPLVQDLIKVCHNEISSQFSDKMTLIQSVFNSPVSNNASIKKYMLKLFQDYHQTVFLPLDTEKIANKYKTTLKPIYSKEAEQVLASPDLKDFVKTIQKISTFMILQDPPLELEFEAQTDVKSIENVEDFYCIDGFPKNSLMGVVVVPAVTRNKQPYPGIKPALLVVTKQVSVIVPQTKKSPVSKSPAMIKELSPGQVYDLYARFKQNFHKYKAQKSLITLPNRSLLSHKHISPKPLVKSTSHTKTMSALLAKRLKESLKK